MKKLKLLLVACLIIPVAVVFAGCSWNGLFDRTSRNTNPTNPTETRTVNLLPAQVTIFRLDSYPWSYIEGSLYLVVPDGQISTITIYFTLVTTDGEITCSTANSGSYTIVKKSEGEKVGHAFYKSLGDGVGIFVLYVLGYDLDDFSMLGLEPTEKPVMYFFFLGGSDNNIESITIHSVKAVIS